MARLVINPRLDNNRDSLFKSIQISKDPNHEMDLQVRLAELSVTGSLRSTKKLAQHRGPAHKMTLLPDSPYIVLSAGEDGQVFSWHWSWSITCFSEGFVHWYQRAQTWQDIALTEWKRQKGMQGNGRVIVWFIRVILILTKVGILISTWFQVVPFGLRFSKQSLFLMYDPSFCCP